MFTNKRELSPTTSNQNNGPGSGSTRWIIIATIIASGLLVGWYFMESGKKDGLDFTLTSLNGDDFSLGDFRGSVVVLDFMATWCGPCRASMPSLVSIYEELGDQFQLISISVDPTHDTEEVLGAWAEEHGADWIHARDLADPPVSREFEVTGVPTFYVIDKTGDVRFRHVGMPAELTLKTEILSLVNE